MAQVLITGASSGVGLALARAFLARGDRVIGTSRSGAAEAFGDLSAAFEPRALDVTSAQSLAALSAGLGGRGLDVLVANAGILIGRSGIEDPSNDARAWADVFAVNVIGVVQTIRAFLPNVTRAGGKIAVISSRMGSSARTGGDTYAYRASKAATNNFVLNLSLELEGRGVPIVALHPGRVASRLNGPVADIDAQTSAAGLVARIDNLSLASSGAFLLWDGSPIPY